MTHFHRQGAGRRFLPNIEDPREEVPHEENDGEAQKTRRLPHEESLVKVKTKSATPGAITHS
jgi:hypothetical protein